MAGADAVARPGLPVRGNHVTHLRRVAICGLAGLLALLSHDSEGTRAQDVEEGRATAGAASGLAEARRNEAKLGKMEELRALGYLEWDSGADTTRRGAEWIDRENVAPGYNLYSNGRTKVFLTDLDGVRVHTWQLPEGKRWCEHAELLHDGKLAVMCINESFTVVDRDSNVLLDVKLNGHHDIATLPDGGFLVPLGRPEKYRGRRVLFDVLVWLSPDGTRIKEWSSFAHLSELQALHAPSPLDVPPPPGVDFEAEKKIGIDRNSRERKWLGYDYYHLNTIEILPDTPLGRKDPRFRAGNLLICLRNADLILILDQDDLSVAWSWGPDDLDLPHMPTMLENGNLLIFDNGKYRGFTRVIELDPVREKIVWEYRGDPPESFFSELRGSVQRLDNGNTLICESERGHAFEVTKEGEKVWEFWNPALKHGKRKRIYRFMRYPTSTVEPLLKKPKSRRPGTRPAAREAGAP